MIRLFVFSALAPATAFAHEGAELHAHVGQTVVSIGTLAAIVISVGVITVMRRRRAASRENQR
jgi:nitrate reductase gamma subunit